MDQSFLICGLQSARRWLRDHQEQTRPLSASRDLLGLPSGAAAVVTNGRILLAHSPSQNVTEGLMAADFLLVDNFAAAAQLSQQASCKRARLDSWLRPVYLFFQRYVLCLV